MKRRDFLRYSIQTALVASLPIALVKSGSAGQLWGHGTVGLIGPAASKKDIETWIRACLKKTVAERMDELCYDNFAHPFPVHYL